MKIGEKIRQARKDQKLSQAQLASRLNIDKSEVSNYERGTRIPRTKRLGELATVLGLSIYTLLEGLQIERHGFRWGVLEHREAAMAVPCYEIAQCSEVDTLSATTTILTERGSLPNGLYIWVTANNIALSSIIVNRNIRVLIRYDEAVDIGDITLFKLNNEISIGEFCKEKQRNVLVCHNGLKHENCMEEVIFIGKVVQIALDL